jgi:ElaB/YqjD/DUF883 family membrane-anchored ribosome-binding protein
MNESTPTADNDTGTLAEDARALMAATAEVAGEKVGEARKRLAIALEAGKKAIGRVKEKAVEGAKATDKAVHDHPYMAIGIAVGIGALVGFLTARSSCRKRD